MKAFIITAASLGLCSMAAGCLYEIRDEIVDCEISCQNKRRASDSWEACADVYEGMEHQSDFKDGFRCGYLDIANGGDGCQPAIPPAKYWKAKYQCEEGKCKTTAWFDGFSHGALAATGDGVADMNHIVARAGRPGPEIVLPNGGHAAQGAPMPMADDNLLPPPPSPAAEVEPDVKREANVESLFDFENAE